MPLLTGMGPWTQLYSTSEAESHHRSMCPVGVCVLDGEGGIFKVLFVFPSHSMEVKEIIWKP